VHVYQDWVGLLTAVTMIQNMTKKQVIIFNDAGTHVLGKDD